MIPVATSTLAILKVLSPSPVEFTGVTTSPGRRSASILVLLPIIFVFPAWSIVTLTPSIIAWSFSNKFAPNVTALLAFLPLTVLASVKLNECAASNVPITRPSLSITSPLIKSPDTCSR